ncbi:MAG: FecR family protein, partial [Rikenellaceae bacterium]
SSLRFPRQFGTDERRVYLEGEAYFSVTKSDVPFIVESKEMKLRVYGTQFNVKTNGIGQTETILIEGSVGIQAKKGTQEYMMKPSQLATVCEHGKVNVSTVNSTKYLSWLKGCFIMELDPVARLLTDIEHWYGVTFIYPDNFDKEKLFSVQIRRDMKIDELLESLEMVLNVEFSKERSDVYRIKNL